jgi:hypothetical protein
MPTEAHKKYLSEFEWRGHDLKDQNWTCVEADHKLSFFMMGAI